MIRDWIANKAGKTSPELFSVLKKMGYICHDPKNGSQRCVVKECPQPHFIRAISLIKYETVQTVERCLMKEHPGAWQALLGELRIVLRLNLDTDLEDRPESALDAEGSKAYESFLRGKENRITP